MTLYKKFIKHAKKIAEDLPGNKPVLKGINHYVNGSLAATNSHILYYGKDLHDKELVQDTAITPAGVKLKQDYPDISRLLPESSMANFSGYLSVAEYLKATDVIQVAGKLTVNETDMVYSGNTLSFTSEDISANYTVSMKLPDGETLISNALYWVNALKMFKDFKYTDITFNYFSRFRPFTLVSPDDKLTVLIMPMRSR